jgi:serine/threonine protein kinase
MQHADVKPSNILLDGELVPKILDFGLSKVFKAGQQYTKEVVGCLDYMDPMSIVSNRLTPKSDVYNFGVVLLELICRKPAVAGESRLTLEYKRVYDQDKSGNFEERPAMDSVASALVILRDTWETKKRKGYH